MHVFIAVQDFTQACHLQRHIQTCAQGKTVIECPAEKVELPQTAFEKAFYPKHPLLWNLFVGLNKKQYFVKFTFTTLLAGMEVKDGLRCTCRRLQP